MTTVLVYTVRRLLAAIPVLLAASIFVFLLVDLSGDPIAEQIFVAEATGEPLSDEAIADLKARLYHDRSIPERYLAWLVGDANVLGAQVVEARDDIGLLQGKFGPTVEGGGREIGNEIGNRLLTTLRLVGFATVLGIIVGIATGVISAVRQYSKTDHTITFIGFLALAMPVFWFGLIIKQVGIWLNDMLEGTVGIRPFYTVGARSPVQEGFTAWDTFTDIFGHLILPTITLTLVGYAVFSRFQRASMLEVLNSDYVRLARAKGLRNRVVMRRHALRTALIPVLTLVTLSIAGTVDGAVLTETVFQWQGLGRYFIDRLNQADTFAIMGFLILSGTLIVLANLVADLLYAVLDPRIRYD
jgi:peptide/nickel transport system permease protein